MIRVNPISNGTIPAIELYSHLHWTSLSLLGACVILLASLVERHQQAIVEWGAELRRRAARSEAPRGEAGSPAPGGGSIRVGG